MSTLDPTSSIRMLGLLGDYRIVRQVGRGGMGAVYEAIQQSLARRVALKILSVRGELGPMAIERFALEARSAARLNHGNIVPVYGVGETHGVHYYAMQFIDGRGLDSILDELRTLTGRSRPTTAPHSNQGSERLTMFFAGPTAFPASPSDGSTHIPAQLDGSDSGAPTLIAPAPVPANVPAPDEAPKADGLEKHDLTRKLPEDAVPAGSRPPGTREFYGWAARISLQVAEALAYAHQQGILHRDIKPSNLLLDSAENVWVTDFGLAKLEGSDGMTKTGDFVGTIRYMAPERFSGWSDRRSDVYSLGATLYELLTLRPLFIGSTHIEVMHKVLHDDPLPPRRVEPAIPRDLETIILKSIAREPADRYPSAVELAQDLRSFLEDRPIQARQSTAAERFRAWHRRNKRLSWVSSIAATAILLLAVFAIAAAWTFRGQRDRIAAHLDQIRRSEAETKAVLDFLRYEVIAAARPRDGAGDLSSDVTLRAALDAAEPSIEKTFAREPAVEASIRDTLGRSYAELGEPAIAIKQYERALALRRMVKSPDDPETLATMDRLAGAYHNVSRLNDALALYQDTLRLRRQKLGPVDRSTLLSAGNLAMVYQDLGRSADAIRLHETTLDHCKTQLGADHSDTLSSMNALAAAYFREGRIADAVKLHEETLRLRLGTLGPKSVDTLIAMNNAAQAYRAADRLADAIRLYEQALSGFQASLDRDHPYTLAAMSSLAQAYKEAARVQDAVPLLAEATKLSEAKLGANHIDTLTSMASLADAYREAGRLTEARSLFEETVKRQEASLGDDHPDTLRSQSALAETLREMGKLEPAISLFEKTLAKERLNPGPLHPDTLRTMSDLAEALVSAGRPTAAVPLLEATLAAETSKLRLDRPQTLVTRNALARALLAAKSPKVEPLLREAMASDDQKAPPDWRAFETRSLLGGCLLAQKNFYDAEPLLVQGYDGLISTQSHIPARYENRIAEAGARVVALFEARGAHDKAAEWRARLSSATSKPPARNPSERTK